MAIHKPFMLLLLARVISRFGDSIDSIAYSWMVYELTGSKILMGTLFVLNYVPGILFSFFAGALVDRWPKRTVAAITYLGRGIIVIFTAFLYLTGLLKPWHLYIFTFIISTFECLAAPAEIALVPRLLPAEKLLSGNAISTSASRISELIGLGMAGVIIACSGIFSAILLDGLTFITASTLIAFIRIEAEPNSPSSSGGSSFLQEIKAGLSFLAANRLILTLMFAGAFVNFCLTPYNVLNPVYVDQILKSGPYGLSVLGICLTVGMIVSGLWISRKGSAFKKSRLILTGYLLLGSNYALLYLPALIHFHPLYPAAFFSFGLGTAISFSSIPVSTYFMEVVPKELLGRVGAVFNMASTCAMPLGSTLTGIIGEWMKVQAVYLSFGLLLLLPIAYLLKQPSFMKI